MTGAALKLAVASKDGIAINLHFGHAKEFWIYQLTPQGCVLLERREVDHYCHGQTGDQSAMQKILKTIGDCSAVFVAKIGDGPIAKLSTIGVQSVDDYAYLGIEESLRDYASSVYSETVADNSLCRSTASGAGMSSDTAINRWVLDHPLQPVHVDCAVAVMLKILDGKCKMNSEEKLVMAQLYHALKQQPGKLLGADMHQLIALALQGMDEPLREAIYEKRVLAETMISRPVMKAFKKMIREQGLFDETVTSNNTEDKSHAAA